MAEIRAFTPVRYAAEADLSRVTCPPYDVISLPEREKLRVTHPENYVRIILPTESTPGAGDSYRSAADYLRMWLQAGVLVRDHQESCFLYRTDYSFSGSVASSAGLVGALRLERFGEESIFPHEETMPGPKADRLELMRATQANLEPLWFVTGRPIEGFGPLVSSTELRPTLADFTDIDGVRHRLWKLPPGEEDRFATAIESNYLVVADGHHRYETALTYRDETRAQKGEGPWDFTLALVSDLAAFPPALLPIHRIVRGVSWEGLSGRLAVQPFDGDLTALERAVTENGPGLIGVASGNQMGVIASDSDLDTEYLEKTLASPEVSVTYEHHFDRVASEIASGAVGFLLAPIPLSSVVTAAADGRRMPPKTTLFWPKPRSGLVLRDLS